MDPRNSAQHKWVIGVPLIAVLVIVVLWLLCYLLPWLGPCSGCPWKPGLAGGPTTPQFLAADDFQGTWEGKAGWVTFIGKSTWEGRLAFVNLPRAQVSSLLAPGLELAQPLQTSTQLHPVLLMDGTQKELTTQAATSLGLPVYYPEFREIIVLVPFVVGKDSTCQKFHSWVVRMYLDDPVPVSGGLWWGYRKLLAEIQKSTAQTEIHDPMNGVKALEVSYVDSMPWYADGRPHIENYAVMQQILEMPIIGQNPSSPFVCSYWMWSFANVQSRRSSASLEFHPGFSPSTPWTGQTLQTVTGGAVQLEELHWWLSTPIQCSF